MDEKYIILVGDGMGDYPLDRLGGKTPLDVADTPNIDRLVRIGRMGTVRTVPHGMEPGSDVANMSLLGYNPAVYHTGRGPLEAASMGVKLAADEIAFRCNLVFLEKENPGGVLMGDYSAGHITTPEAHEIISSLREIVCGTPLDLYPGVSYRHLLVWKGGLDGLKTTPPHDITGQPVALHDFISAQPVLKAFVDKADLILGSHPVNLKRKAEGRKPANAVWLWGQGKAPSMPKLDRFGISGAMISAVDLLKGIGVYAGLDPVAVPGATGYLDTNYDGKVAAALAALDKGNFVFLHFEAPDEASHEGDFKKKIEAIQNFDIRIVGQIVSGLRYSGRVRILVAMDHFTPISMRTHVSDPVPFLLVEDIRSAPVAGVAVKFCERDALAANWRLDSGEELFRIFLGNFPPQ